MAQITTRENLESTPLADIQAGLPPIQAGAAMVNRVVTLAKCLRCGFEWMPRSANPVKCAKCRTPLWNVPYAVQKPGKPAPTRKGLPRGKPLSTGFDPRRQPRKPVKKAAPDSSEQPDSE